MPGNMSQMIRTLKCMWQCQSRFSWGFAPVGLDGYKDLDPQMKMALYGFPIEGLIFPNYP
jgi:hypothetical protein